MINTYRQKLEQNMYEIQIFRYRERDKKNAARYELDKEKKSRT